MEKVSKLLTGTVYNKGLLTCLDKAYIAHADV